MGEYKSRKSGGTSIKENYGLQQNVSSRFLLQEALRQNNRVNVACREIEKMLDDISRTGAVVKEKMINMGKVDRDVLRFAENNGITIGSKYDFMDGQHILHTQRSLHKNNNLYVGDETLKNFPKMRYKMDVYYDTEKRRFVYTDKNNKFVISPYQKSKKHKKHGNVSLYITGVKLKEGNTEFSMGKYIKIR